MEIKLRRSGGIAGLTLPPEGPLEIDSRELPEGEGLELRAMLRGLDLEHAGAGRKRPARGADHFVYDLTLDDEGRTARAVMPAEEIPSDLRRALDRLLLRHLEGSA